MGDHWRIAPRLCMARSGRRFAPHRPVRLLLAGYWAVLGVDSVLVLPVGGLASSDGGGLVPGADPARGVASCWRGPARGMSRLLWRRPVPGAGLAAGDEIST